MNNITSLCQRNIQWKNTLLGYSGSITIGTHGCLVTALACLARIDDPRKVNEILKANNGFVNEDGGHNEGTYVVWSCVSEIPGLKFNYRYYSYDNEKVKEIITKNGGCIVEVDGAPIGGYRHWLLYIGGQLLIDPWDGLTKSTSEYTPISFVDIEYTENMDALQECLNQHTMLVNKCNELEESKKVLQQALNETQSSLKEVLTDIEEMKDKLSTQEKELLNRETRIKELTDEVNRRTLTIAEKDKTIKDLELKLSTVPEGDNLTPTLSNVLSLFRLWLRGWLK